MLNHATAAESSGKHALREMFKESRGKLLMLLKQKGLGTDTGSDDAFLMDADLVQEYCVQMHSTCSGIGPPTQHCRVWDVLRYWLQVCMLNFVAIPAC